MYYILYQYEDQAPEIIDQAPTKATAQEYLEEYRQAYREAGKLWTTSRPRSELLREWEGQ